MRIFADLIENLANGVRLIAGLMVLLIMGTALAMSFGVSWLAGDAVEELTISAEKVQKEAIRAQQEAELNRQLAKDGWGYQAGEGGLDDDFASQDARPSDRDDQSDWGSTD